MGDRFVNYQYVSKLNSDDTKDECLKSYKVFVNFLFPMKRGNSADGHFEASQSLQHQSWTKCCSK